MIKFTAKKMRKLFLNCCFLLLIVQFNVFGLLPFQTDDVNSLTPLKTSLTIQANIYYGDEEAADIMFATNDKRKQSKPQKILSRIIESYENSYCFYFSFESCFCGNFSSTK